MVAKSCQCYTLFSCKRRHLFTTLPLGFKLVAKNAPVSNNISISIDGDGCPLIFLWGNLADFSDIPTSEYLRADQYRITGIAIPRTGLKITISDWNNAGIILSEISLEITSYPTTANLQSVLTKSLI